MLVLGIYDLGTPNSSTVSFWEWTSVLPIVDILNYNVSLIDPKLVHHSIQTTRSELLKLLHQGTKQ